MSDLDKQLREYKALRDSARTVLKADIEHVRTGLSGKGLAERTVSRIGAGTKDALGQATSTADDHRGVLAALIGAIILWFARQPIAKAIGFEGFDDDADLDDEAAESAQSAGSDAEKGVNTAQLNEIDGAEALAVETDPPGVEDEQ
ncbi:MAG: hypothetical protein ABJP48_09420 [Erythrobacter sp.]